MKTKDYDIRKLAQGEPLAGGLMPASEEKNQKFPHELDLLPMVDLNIFPQLVYPISVEDSRARSAIHRCLDASRPMALFAVKELDVDPYCIQEDDFYPVGLAVLIHKAWDTDKGNLKVVVQGLSRIKMLSLSGDDKNYVTIEPLAEEAFEPEVLRPLVLEAKRLFAQVSEKLPGMLFNPSQFNSDLEEKPGLMADLMVASLPLKRTEKIEFIGLLNIEERLLKLLEHLTLDLANLETGQAVARRMKDNIDRRQRELHLREQLKAIEAELGDGDDGDDLDALADRLYAKALPVEARAVAEKEFKKLKKTSPQNSEYGVIRNYLELILDLPWKEATFDRYDLELAREVLGRDHFGMDKVKKRIVEYLAVRKLTGRVKSPMLCLVGPPGVGKTSLGRSIADALGREFVRLSLGGVRDEAEIRGHRRTYVGALPGRIIAGLKKAKSNNPVFLLDELDKMTQNMMGDPASALLEVLDPEQNGAFSDHYLEIPFDLSNVMFILTANVLEHISGPLRDRLEVVELCGYTQEEKLEIARRHLLPQEVERHGLAGGDLIFSDEALNALIESYTREAGVRDLTRRLGAVARSVAVEKVEGLENGKKMDVQDLKDALGAPRHQREFRAIKPQGGIVTGLAWTPAGGDILFIEAVAMPGKGQLTITGQLGEVMRESAKAAVSYVRSRALDWSLDPAWFEKNDIHLHIPQGAIPKDGPSAGAAMATAIASLARGMLVRPEVAMTGEISLRGLILPVGGIKEKLLAAKRAGIKKVLIPEKNRADLAEMSEQLLNGLTVTAVGTLDEALTETLIGEGSNMEEIGLSQAEEDSLAELKEAWALTSPIGFYLASEYLSGAYKAA